MQFGIPSFERAHVLVIGDVMLDRYWHGGTDRISPEAPVPVVKVKETEERPGGAGNVALNLQALGVNTHLFGLCGEDESANILHNKLDLPRIKCHFQRVANKPTITKLRVVSLHQQLIRLDFEEDMHTVDSSPLIEACLAQIPYAQAVIMSDYGKGSLRHHAKIIAATRAANVPVFVDPKGQEFAAYRGASVLTPNYKEFTAVVGPCRNEQELMDKGLHALEKYQLNALLVTRGAQGMTLLRQNKPELHLPAKAREVYDVTGAGDTVIAVLAAATAAGEPLENAMALANRAASVVVAKLGAATVSVPELRRAIQKDQATDTGIMTEEQLLIAIEDARAHGERIVMTNGCFDILHAGHIAYLEQAKSLGQRLIVAVNDDASVVRLKGESRPINTLQRRMAVLAGLSAVDWVVPFSEDTPERLINGLLPDILVKGGDYKVEEIAGGACVRAHGGEVKVLHFEEDCSTSAIVDKLQNEAESA